MLSQEKVGLQPPLTFPKLEWMTVLVNNEPKPLKNGAMLQNLLFEIGMVEQKGFAVAVNDEVIPKTKWNTHALKDNDNILIITATQGG